MLIRALRARNFMRFERIELSDVPEVGLVGIEGPNESGKSTIGDAILFAFFGRTLSAESSSVENLIRWGTDSMEVEVDFGVPGRGEYRIHREIDKFGTNFVKVVEADSRRELATGNIQVAKLMGRLLRCDRFEFLRSFFQGQVGGPGGARERERFAERLAGVAQLRDAIASIRKEIEAKEREFAQFRKEIQRNRVQLEKYRQAAGHLPALRENAEAKRRTLEEIEARARELRAAAEAARARAEEREAAAKRLDAFAEGEGSPAELARDYERQTVVSEGDARELFGEIAAGLGRLKALDEALDGLRSRLDAYLRWLADDLNAENARSGAAECERLDAACRELVRRRRRSAGVTVVGLVVAIVFGGLAAAVRTGAIPAPLHLGALEIPADGLFWSCVGAGVVGVFGLLGGLARAVALGGLRREREANLLAARERQRATRRECERVEVALEAGGSGAELLDAAGRLDDSDLRARAGKIEEDFQALLEKEDPRRAEASAWAARERELGAAARAEAERLDREQGGLARDTRRARSARERAESELRDAESQGAKMEALEEKNEDLADRAEAVKTHIDRRHLAIELLNETIATIESRLGPALARFVRGVLPRLTAGRYKDLRIDANLAVEIFTGRKCDFLDLGELSGGTREALDLALRLAFAQAFVDSRVKQPQFLFLDEPFQKMDEWRSLESLRAIRTLSPDLRQVFVIQPRFSEPQRALLDHRLDLDAESETLVAAIGSAARPAASGEGEAASRPEGGGGEVPPAPGGDGGPA